MNTKPVIGGRVTYRDVSAFLSNRRGTLLEIGTFGHGGDCLVQWHTPNAVKTPECLSNLMGV